MYKHIVYKGKSTNYIIYEDGAVVNIKTGKKLKRLPIDKNQRYERVKLSIDGVSHCVGIHRLLMMAFHPVDNMDLLQVNHIDGDRHNNDLSNLEWCTPSENIVHAFRHNLRIPMSGENNGRAKLNAKIVTDICNDIMENKYTEQELANKYNISSSLIHNIKKKKTWKFITEKYNFPKQIEGNVKLTEEDIENICKYILNGYTNSEISEMFNVSKSCIKDIRGRRSWRKITEKYF